MFVNDVRFILCSPREIQIQILVFVPLIPMNYYYYCSSKLSKLYYFFLSFKVMFLVNSEICARMGQEFGESIIYLKIHNIRPKQVQNVEIRNRELQLLIDQELHSICLHKVM